MSFGLGRNFNFDSSRWQTTVEPAWTPTDGDGVRELYVGSLAHVSEGIFPSSIDYLALGHLHVPQSVGSAKHIRYSGSPIPMGYGEATQDKKVILVEFNSTTPNIKEIQVPCFQALVRIVGSLDDIHAKVEQLKQEESRAWLEIEYTGRDIISNLREMLDESMTDSAMEILRIKNKRVIDRVINAIKKEETLDDLNTSDVFVRCLDEDGTAEHYGEYLNAEQGTFPNYEFLRELKEQLENDSGSIFRYSNHENTFLNMIYRQLQADQMVIEDRTELCDFIKSITQSVGGSTEQWVGDRNMVDMWELVKRDYYDPATNGSNSIKQVLPAILNSSLLLQGKYSKPIYGALGGIKSHNFKDWQWIKFESGKVVDPYKLLPKMFQDISDNDMRILSDDDELRDGGAALTAYARMQFEEMTDVERKEIQKALLKYCELDTFAMVMIYEEWKSLLQ